MTRHYVITGSSEGLGAALSEKLLAQDNLVIGISRRGNLKLSQLSNFINFKADVSNYREISELFDDILNRYKTVHGVVHAAAVSGPIGRIENTVPSEWVDAINTNLIGSYNLISICAKHFREIKSGNFLAISGGGATSPMPRMTAYAASKAGLVRLIESVARDFDELPNVTFNVIAPGIMKTKMIDEIIEAGPDVVGMDYFLKMYEFRKDGKDSLPKAIELIEFLISRDGHRVNGKLISAIWDEWLINFSDHSYLNNKEVHTLRRTLLPEIN